MKKVLFVIICLSLGLVTYSQVVFINPTSQEVNPSQAFTTTVEISLVQNLGAFAIELSFDANLLQVTSLSLGSFLGSTGRTIFPLINNFDNTIGLIEYAVTTLGSEPPGPDGDGVLLIIEWISTSSGNNEISTDLILQNIQIAEPNGSVIPVDIINGTVTILFPEILNTIVESSIVCPGTVMVPITVVNFEDITSFSLNLNYNSNELSYTSFQNVNPQLTELIVINDGVSLQINYSGSAVTINNGIIIEFLFTAPSNDSQVISDLIWDEANCSYSNSGGSVNAIYTNGTQTINPFVTSVDTPEGPTEVDIHYTPSSLYTITQSQNADNYIWEINPPAAGDISGNDIVGAVIWNPNFQGNAFIKVTARNDCNSILSDSLEVFLDNSVGISEIEFSVQVFPNPSKSGIYHIYFSNHIQKIEYEIYNSNGQIIKRDIRKLYSNTFYLDLRNYKQGIYYLRIKDIHGFLNLKLIKL